MRRRRHRTWIPVLYSLKDRVRRPGDETRAALVARNLAAGVSCPVDRASRWVLVAPWIATTLSLRAA
ncbi:hypothetical protein [Ferrimicrobium acidiphilum]|uniref:hypothetical protein n=1 Tax=Ferrimicrobium acidiphilum TaxID=121039 RepID=UPI0034DD1AE8